MKFSTTVLFFLLFIGVCYAYITLSPEKAEEANGVIEQTTPQILMELEEGDFIYKIQIYTGQDESMVEMSLVDDHWRITHPVYDRADEVIVKGLSSALSLSKKIRTLETEKGWDEYGLAKPAIKIGVQTKKTDFMRYLYLGDLSPVGNYVYAKWEEDRDYFLLDKNLRSVFSRDLFSLRDKRVIQHSLQNIVKIRISTFDHRFELAFRQGQWVWVEPIALMGEEIPHLIMGGFLSFMTGLLVKDFLDDSNPNLKDYGLDDPPAAIEIWTAAGEPVEKILIGGDFVKRNAYYSKRQNENVIYLISQTKMNEFFEALESILEQNAKILLPTA